jgi:hypothetical protein
LQRALMRHVKATVKWTVFRAGAHERELLRGWGGALSALRAAYELAGRCRKSMQLLSTADFFKLTASKLINLPKASSKVRKLILSILNHKYRFET